MINNNIRIMEKIISLQDLVIKNIMSNICSNDFCNIIKILLKDRSKTDPEAINDIHLFITKLAETMPKKNIKLVLNAGYGGFGLSNKAISRLKELGENSHPCAIPRYSKNLIQVVEELGSEVNNVYSKLVIEEIELSICEQYQISEYDGKESVIIM